ncbi:MAG: selenide, water dikinase SelD [Deltaproteobacteria bacterium]|nr:selenide, water dikinase SelD [Deltaproteobacteria bacterium]
MGPGGLREILGHASLPGGAWDPRVLVGLAAPDDAAVIAVGPGPALVLTADVITPPCDDPFLFGQLAATNAMSDVYAMGGEPVAALNLCFFPEDDVVPPDVKSRILEGAAERVAAAGASIVGGHTVRDAELKLGLSVMGQVDPARILRKGGLRAGQALVLTKALGLGLIINGYRNDACTAEELETVLRAQVALNRDAARIAVRFGATGATDITGFGLVGHALEMARGAGVRIRMAAAALPVLPLALALSERGIRSRGLRDNETDGAPHLVVEGTLDPHLRVVCFDPQTAGGLLFGVDAARAEACVAALAAAGAAAARVVGRVEEGAPGLVVVA